MKLARTSLFLSFVAAVLLLVASGSAAAAPLAMEIDFLNSNLTFGGPSFNHYGYDNDYLTLYGEDLFDNWFPDDTEFEASGGTFVQQTPVTDGSGTLVRTDYRYVGGTFRVDFVLQPGGPIAGSFTAPVVSLDIMASEPLHAGFSSGVGASSVLARYVLGPGVFDAAFASAMGIPRRTGIGEMFTDTLLFAGDHSTPELIADDGATYGGVQAPAAVPETPQSVLAALGVLAILLVRFSRTSRTITNL